MMFLTGTIFPGVGVANPDYEESERIIDICTVNLRCPAGFESQQIKRFSSLVNRGAQGLSLGLDGGEFITLTLKDYPKNVEGFRKYVFISYFTRVGYYLVHLQQYEGGTVYMYINARDGTIETTNAFRHYSPDGEHYVASHVDIDYEFPDNWISIMQLDSKGAQKEFSIIYQPELVDGKSKYTGPANLKWVSVKRIEFEEISIIGGRPPYIKNKAYLERESGKWVYHGSVDRKHLESIQR